LPRDIYYIDRKSAENKSTIEFELASILDVEGVKLPNRLVLANRCTATYRCEGCLYEYRKTGRYKPSIHGDAAFEDLPPEAPPVATEKDEIITEILGIDKLDGDGEEYDVAFLNSYGPGSSVFIRKNDIPYYFVCKATPPLSGPPDTRYWILDACSKTVRGCKLRWKTGTNVNLPFNGFPSANSIR
jgi:rubredoxin